jgi:CBS domain containing-hemolysin-like protein
MHVISLLPVLASATAAAPDPIQLEWDSPGIIFLKLATVIFFVLLNGFFVAAEFAIVKVRISQLQALEAAGDKRVGISRQITSHLDAYLSATQLGITLASLALGWLGEPFVATLVQPLLAKVNVTSAAIIESVSFTFAFATITFLHIVLGELTPKSLAIRRAVATTLWVGKPLRLFYNFFKPAIALLNGTANFILRALLRIDPVAESELAHSEEELRHILAESAKSSEVSSLGKDILLHTLDFRHRYVRDVMTPRGEVLFLNAQDPFEENVKIVQSTREARFPLCEGHLDNTLGVVHSNDILALANVSNPDLRAIKTEIVPVPEMMSLDKLLTAIKADANHLALVVDEFGGTVGVVRLENVLEELVGEIQNDSEPEPPSFVRVGDGKFLVEGSHGLYELRDELGLELESSDVSTIGGYVTQLLGHFPQINEQTRIENYRVTVTRMDFRRVGQLRFDKESPSD